MQRTMSASMRHQDHGTNQSLLIYTYTFQVGPAPFRALLDPAVDWIMTGKTHQRFQRLAQFLANHGNDIAAWQQDRRVPTSAPHCAEA